MHPPGEREERARAVQMGKPFEKPIEVREIPPLPANPNGQPPGPVVPGQQVAAAQPGSEQSAKNPEQTSAELQQRIEARRQQIRDQNERAKQGQPQPQPQHQPQ